jgi:lysophospholipase L1-like esterase
MKASFLLAALALLLAPSAAMAKPDCMRQWSAAWAASQFQPDANNALPAGSFGGQSLRQIIRPTLAGLRVRLRLSNLAGTKPLHLAGVTLARALAANGAAVDTKSLIAVRFDGKQEVTIPAGAEYLSDPIAVYVNAFDNLAITILYDEEPSAQTSHPGSRATSYLAKGDHLSDPAMSGANTTDHWFQLSGLEVETCRPPKVLVALGDSITDGRGSTTNGNDRWTDLLAARLQAQSRTRHTAVINQGIGGNRLLLDGLGPSALARFDRDVVAQAGVTHLLILEGINDLGTLTREAPVPLAEHERLVAAMIGAYRQMIERAHARGIKVIGATIMPFVGNEYYHADTQNEADRQAVNRWIREKGHFDAVVDFDAVIRDPANPSRMRKDYDVGDALHPSPAGYRAMAQAVDLALLAD